MKYRTLLAAPLLALILLGCGEEKANMAVNRVLSRPKPGALRLVNLTSAPATLWHKNRILNPGVGTGSSGRLNPVGVGKQTVDIETDGKKMQVEVDLQSGLGDTILLFPGGKTIVVRGDPQYPEDGKNAFVTFLTPEGKTSNAKSSLVASGQKIELSAEQSRITVPEGLLESPDGKATITVMPNFAYSLILLKQGNSWRPILLLNSDERKAMATGSAAS